MMQISVHPQSNISKASIQYSVYAYDKYSGDIIGYNKWRCLLNSENKEKALAEAERLFKTEKFQKIEVKKKFFNSKKQKHLVSTYCVLDGQPKRNYLLIGALLFLSFSALVLFVLETL